MAKFNAECFAHLKYEFNNHKRFFSRQTCNGKLLNVENSFSPSTPHRFIVPTVRVFFLLLNITEHFMCWKHYFHFAPYYNYYLTRWGVMVTIMYNAVACYVTLERSQLEQPLATDEPKCLVKLMWALYNLCTPAMLLITLLYWFADDHGSNFTPNYSDLHAHLFVFLFLVMDGMVLSKIPIRMRHIIFVSSFAFSYVTFSVFQEIYNIGGVHLYPILQWKRNPSATAVLCVSLMVAAIPILYLLLWTLSFILGYKDTNKTVNVVEDSGENDCSEDIELIEKELIELLKVEGSETEDITYV